MEKGKEEEISALAGEIFKLAHDNILINMRFMDAALSSLRLEERAGTGAFAYDGVSLYYDPAALLSKYKKEPHYAVRLYLHTLFHCVFYHGYKIDKLNRTYWNLAVDIAVEAVTLSLGLGCAALPTDTLLKSRLDILQKRAGGLGAEKLYRLFKIEPPSDKAAEEWAKLCHYDEHIYWDRKEELNLSQNEWRKVSERLRADLKSFSKDKNNVEGIEENLKEALKEKYSYTDFLRRFMVMGEAMQVSDDEFDYIYYTYGLSRYKNMPLIEPLEYKEANKIKDFVIALDTSASCRGSLVRAFLNKTYGLMRESENFFNKINVHIIQCDNEVRSDTKITCWGDFDKFLTNGKLKGFGSTDFRPVFDYVGELKRGGEFDSLKGLIYFTDGYGIYPESMPDYDTAFVFLNDDEDAPAVPPWAVRVVLDSEQLEEMEEDNAS